MRHTLATRARRIRLTGPDPAIEVYSPPRNGTAYKHDEPAEPDTELEHRVDPERMVRRVQDTAAGAGCPGTCRPCRSRAARRATPPTIRWRAAAAGTRRLRRRGRRSRTRRTAPGAPGASARRPRGWPRASRLLRGWSLSRRYYHPRVYAYFAPDLGWSPFCERSRPTEAAGPAGTLCPIRSTHDEKRRWPRRARSVPLDSQGSPSTW